MAKQTKRKYARSGTLPQYQFGGTPFSNQYTGAQLDRIQYGIGQTGAGGQFQNSGGFEQYASGFNGVGGGTPAAAPVSQSLEHQILVKQQQVPLEQELECLRTIN